MKIYIYILSLLFLLPFIGLAQNDTIVAKETTNYNNQIDLDIHFLGIEAAYKSKLTDKLFIGVGFGGGFLGRVGLNNDGLIEMVKLKTLFEYYFSNSFHLQTIGSYSLVLTGDGEGGGALGAGLGIYFVLGKVELGVEPNVFFVKQVGGDGRYDRGRLVSSLLIVRIPLGRW